jgi:hypothetical protein
METASCRQSATTRAWGSIGSAEISADDAAYATTKWGVHHAGLARDTGRAWWAADGAWSARGRVERAAVRKRPFFPKKRDFPRRGAVVTGSDAETIFGRSCGIRGALHYL